MPGMPKYPMFHVEIELAWQTRCSLQDAIKARKLSKVLTQERRLRYLEFPSIRTRYSKLEKTQGGSLFVPFCASNILLIGFKCRGPCQLPFLFVLRKRIFVTVAYPYPFLHLRNTQID